MKKKELQELRTKEVSQLLSSLSPKTGELARVISDLRLGKIKNVHTGRNLRRDIAQIKTIIKEKRGK